MSPVNRKSVDEKFKKLEESIKMLEVYKKISESDFLKDNTINGATIHYLVLSIEIVVDLGNHILSEIFQDHASAYEEVILKLGELKVIPEDFSTDNANMAKFRNLLIHEYIKVDMKRVYEYLQRAPNIFRKFAEYYFDFIDRF